MFKSIGEKGFGATIMEIEKSPNFILSQRSGIDYAAAGKVDEGSLTGEEVFRSEATIEAIENFIFRGKLNPISKGITRPSERTYTAFLDAQRYVMFDIFAKELASRGLTFRQNPEEFKKIAEFVNIATGRGINLNKWGDLILNLPLFAPRYTLSRLQLLNMTLNPVAYANMPPQARKIVAKNAVRFYGTTMGALGLVAMFGAAIGATVNFDPDDDDFLKIVIGNAKYDIFAGTLQPARVIIRLVHSAIRTKAGADNRLHGEFFNDTVNALGRYVRGKLSPTASLVWDWMAQEDFNGEAFNWYKAISSRVMPLVVIEIREAYKHDGAVGIAKSVPLTFFGVGVQTYKPRPERAETEAEKLANKIVIAGLRDRRQTAQDKEKSRLVADLRARGRRGEDIFAELDAAVEAGKITNDQKVGILASRTKSYLVDQAEGLSIRANSAAEDSEFEAVWKIATEDERRELKPMFDEKMKNLDVEGGLTPERRAKLEAMGGELLGDYRMPEAVQDEFRLLGLKTPDVGETLTVQKGDKRKLTTEQYAKYRSETLEKIYSTAEDLIETREYRDASPDERRTLLRRIISKARRAEQIETRGELVR
jgi:hypothetical protein